MARSNELEELSWASHALGMLHSASEIMSSAVAMTEDDNGDYDPEVWDIHLKLMKAVSKWMDKVARMRERNKEESNGREKA